MKNIKGHPSRNAGEIVAILEKTGGFTMCALPHYRYDRTKDACQLLRKKGLIKKTGIIPGWDGRPAAVHWKTTPLFEVWKACKEFGLTRLNAVAWATKEHKKERSAA